MKTKSEYIMIERAFFVSAMTIKKKIHPKNRLPVFNWMALKPNQVRGTVFSEIDDEKLYDVSPNHLCSLCALFFVEHVAEWLKPWTQDQGV